MLNLHTLMVYLQGTPGMLVTLKTNKKNSTPSPPPEVTAA